ncbi:universal stress protein [Aromatoleum toluolicum]|nr:MULTISPECIES: universal stress protein [Rhodocyclales]KAI5913355.1 universal stress protein [Thauera sp. 2A1]MBS0477229.1 universal stress protein [Pseudomonadota bacterium]NMF99200.2 universal stress protein [Aromatoleum toluolicum]QTQ34804.1 Universal stress protein A [Aromatoleum petrolei]
MYSHILVPTDGTHLASQTISQAVQFARSVGARITFFYADPDAGASLTDDGALIHLLDPGLYQDDFGGRAREILAKAEVSARAGDIDCECVTRRSNRPHEAILAAAKELGCDLIFMASHGPRSIGGVMLASETLKVLAGSRIPVLVSSVEKNDPNPAMTKVCAIIKDEHRSIAVVSYGMRMLAGGLRDGKPADIGLLDGMLTYLDEFPAKLHHPKEDAYLFAALRRRTSSLDQVIDDLQQEHLDGDRQLAALRAAVAHYQASPDPDAETLASAIDAFALGQLRHIALEERAVIPGACEHLAEQDWKEIVAAFGPNGDARFNHRERETYRRLYSRIANLHQTLPRMSTPGQS